MHLQPSWLHNISGMLYWGRIIQLEEQQKKKWWPYEGKVEGEKSLLKQSEEQLGEGQEGGTALRSRRILHNRSALHLIGGVCVPTAH